MANINVFKETTQQAILAELKAQNALMNIIANGYDIDSPAALKELVKSGQIAKWLNIGDVIFIPWTDNSPATPVTYQYPFVVAHIGDVYDANDVKHENALWLMAMYATPNEIAFDAAENTTVDLTQEPNALDGWYYWGVTGSTYTKLTVQTGDALPTTYDSIRKCGINHVDVLKNGYNRWKDSAYRQWLNSDAAKNEGWWTAQHLGDLPLAATQTNYPGWLDGFTQEWRDIFAPVKVQTSCNTVTDRGVTDVTYDTFFLPSLEQMYGVPQAAGVEGDYWEYWKNETGYTEPTNGSSSAPNDARKIPSVKNPTGSAVSVRLRSAARGLSASVWYVYAGGYLYNSNAYYAYRALPACVIC